MSAEPSSGDGVTLPLQELQRLAAALPMPARCDFWRRTLERAAQAESGEVRSRAWDGCLRSLIEEQATGLQTLLQGPAEASGSHGTGNQPISTEGDAPLDSFGMVVALLRSCETWIGTLSDAARRQALQQVLADQLVQLVGRLHRWLVIEEAEGGERAAWFWRSWELLQWRQAMAAPLPAWWPPVQEQLVRLGALAWKERSIATDPLSQVGQQAITRALTLLRALVPLHDPLPIWIPQGQRELAERGLAAILRGEELSEPTLQLALGWLGLMASPEEARTTAEDRGADQETAVGSSLQQQQQVAALALEQAKREGAIDQEVVEAQLQSVMLSLQEALTMAGMAPAASAVEQRRKAQKRWIRLRSRICDALLQREWHGAAALINSAESISYCQPPEGVSREIWTELLLNSCAASEAQLPALQLVESRSLPRSGHHFLRHLLEQACGEQFSYCEGYQEPGCCKNSPCSVAAYWHYAREHHQPHLRLLKSHDFALADANFTPPPAMVRLIQVRKPLELLASWLELEQLTLNRELLKSASIAVERVFLYHEAEVLEEAWRVIDDHGTVMTAEQAETWLAAKVSYVQSFLQKWLPQALLFPFGGRASGGTYVLRYTDLEHSRHILQALGLKSARDRPLPVFATRHRDVTMRRSSRVSTLIQAHVGSLEQADAEIQDRLPPLADGCIVEL